MHRSYCMKFSSNDIIVIREFREIKSPYPFIPHELHVVVCVTMENIQNSLFSLNLINIIWHKRKREKIIGTALHGVDDDDIILSSFRLYKYMTIQMIHWFGFSYYFMTYNKCHCDSTTLCGFVFHQQSLLKWKTVNIWLTAIELS